MNDETRNDDVYAAALGVSHELCNERLRQVREETHLPTFDDMQVKGEIARGAAFFAFASAVDAVEGRFARIIQLQALKPANWTLRPKEDRRRNLVIAGAMIIAEIERLDRAAARSKDAPGEAAGTSPKPAPATTTPDQTEALRASLKVAVGHANHLSESIAAREHTIAELRAQLQKADASVAELASRAAALATENADLREQLERRNKIDWAELMKLRDDAKGGAQ